MRYLSTRDNQAVKRQFTEVLLTGLAPDGGLYVPEYYPHLTWSDIVAFKRMSYTEIAFRVMRLFIDESDIKSTDLRKIIARSYDPRLFGSADITPIQPISKDVGLLRLINGPTFAFKDVALQFLANAMDHVLKQRNQYLNILGATSGDTGSAAEEAVRGRERLRIFMLSPFGRMTPFQRMQMYQIIDPRVINVVPDGTFDDCQTAVKLVNSDVGFKTEYSIGAVNSINWARILAQVVYYVYGYTRVMTDKCEQLTVSVPSGNFGNALAAYVAARMGLRLRILVATNENDVLHQFFKNGVYRIHKGVHVKETHSPSMDIAEASNLERYIFDLFGRYPGRLVSTWKHLAEHGEIWLNTSTLSGGDVLIESGVANDIETIETIKMVFERTGIIIDPHTAVAAKVFYDRQRGVEFGPSLIVETAHPAKFVDAIRQALGIHMNVPASCQHLLENEERLIRIASSNPTVIANRVKEIIASHVD